MIEGEWTTELRLLRKCGVTLAPGLTKDEIRYAEQMHRFRFPPDLRTFLSSALPVGQGFPDWRTPGSPALLDQMSWPFRGVAFDIEHNVFWYKPWGPRPATLSEAIVLARTGVESAPRLIPIYSHRYIPAEPELAGNPVFSVYQTDIIYYGLDLRRYFSCEFDGLDHAQAIRGDLRPIRFWTDVIEYYT
jgi:hypothetical protein